MTGKRQHYIPRLLQRGFLHDPNEEAERTWLHRRDAEPKLVGIRDVGVEDWFYSRKPDGSKRTLDDAITEFEGDLSATVNALRAMSHQESVNADLAANCVMHLVMRTNHLRNVMSKGFTALVEEIQSLFTDPSRLEKRFGLHSPNLAPHLYESIRDAALKLAPSSIPPALAERLMTILVRENGQELIQNATTSLRSPRIIEMR
jgi:hypothetical protein